MRMRDEMSAPAIEKNLLEKLDPDGRLNLAACLQCGRCSSGCAMRLETDILPHQLNRMILLGMEDDLLRSKAIWMCVSCQTCVSRCPMKVDTPALVDKLREISRSAPEDLRKIRVFNDVMLASMRRFGRVWEFGMMGVYKLRALDFFTDLGKLPMMLRKGKFAFLPRVGRGRSAVARIFDRVHRARRAGL